MTEDADQLGMFAPVTLARGLKDTGMELAADAQEVLTPGWAEEAYRAIQRVARRQPFVHVDDVLRENVPPPHHFNAWGAVWKRAMLAHIIVKTGRTAPCLTDPAKHLRECQIYESRLYRSPVPAAAPPPEHSSGWLR